MTLPILASAANDDVSSTLASAFLHSSSTTFAVQSADVARFGSPTPARPLRVRLIKASQVSGGIVAISDPTAAGTYKVTGVAGSTLTGATFESGTAFDGAIGDIIAVAACARDFSDIHAHLASGVVNVLSSGTVAGDGVTDDGPAIQALIDANPGRTIYFPRTASASDDSPSYYLGSTLTVAHPGTTLCGDGGGYQGGTVLKWAPKATGIWLRSAGNCVRDLCLFGSEPWSATHYDEGIVPAGRYAGLTVAAGASDADGVRVGGPYNRLLRLVIQYFGRDAVNGSAGDQGLSGGLGAEDCQYDSLFVGNNRGSGVRFQGGDSNCGQVNGTTAFVNQQWGFDASAFLAGSWVSAQATANGQDGSEQLAGGGDTILGASLVRASNVVTLTFASAYPTLLRAGDGVSVIASPADPSFVGRFRVLAINGPKTVVTYAQVAADASAAGATARACFLPPDGAIASAVRASGVVTLTFSAPYLTQGGGYAAAAGSPFRVGQGISLSNCPDATFNGTFVVLSAPGTAAVTYAQSAPDASISSGTARMAIPFDTWQLSWTPPDTGVPDKVWGGGINAPNGTAPQCWVNPYVEGGQRIRFGRANVAIAPTWSDPLDATWPGGVGLVVSGAGSGTGTPATNLPLGVVWANDLGVSSLTRIGLTAPQLHTDLFQHPIAPGGVGVTFWGLVRGRDEWSLWHGAPNDAGARLRLRFDNTAGYTYLDSEGSGMVRVNADAGYGTGGLLVGDGSGGPHTTSVLGGQVVLAPIPDSAAANGAMFLGSDHGGKLCRKDSGGVVHVLSETP